MNAAAAAAHFARHLEREGTDLSVAWTETSGGTTRPDTGARTGGTTTPRTLTLRAFVHASEADVRSQRFAQTEEGELFVDFVPGALDRLRHPAAGLAVDNVVFTFGGEKFTQRKVGQGIATYHDSVHQGIPICSTVRLTRLK